MRAFGITTTILIAATTAVTAASDTLAPDFRVVAHFGSGHIPVTHDDPANGKIGAWFMQLDAHGFAKIEVFRNAPGKKTTTAVTYSKQELEQIRGAIAKARFFELPRYLDAGLTDMPNYTLEVTAHGRTHRVGVMAPAAFRDKELRKRFISVWTAVCRKMPPKLDDGATRDLQERS